MRALLTRVLSYFETDKWKKILAFIVLGAFVIYYFCAMSPYAAWFPGSKKIFLYTTSSGVAIRAAISIMLVLVGFLTWITYRKTISLKWAFVFGILIFLNIFMVLLTPKTFYVTYQQTTLYSFYSSIYYEIYPYKIILDFLSFAVDVLFGFMFMFIFPKCFTKKMYLTILSLFIFTMFYSFIYSFIKERQYYAYFLSGNWSYANDTIGSIFSDKQSWGVFLSITIPAAFISMYMVSKLKLKKIIKILCYVFLSLVCVLTLVCSLVCFCKTSIVTTFLFLFVFFIGFIVLNIVHKKKIILSVALLAVLVGFVGFLIYVSKSNNIDEKSILGLVKKLLDALITRGQESADIRTDLMVTTFQNFPAINMFLGIPKGLQDYVIKAAVPEMPNFTHTGFAVFLGRTGVFGFTCYAILIGLIIYYSFKIFKRSHFLALSVLGSLLAALILNLSEFEILIMSSSMIVFMSNLICVMLPMSIEAEKGGANYEEVVI